MKKELSLSIHEANWKIESCNVEVIDKLALDFYVYQKTKRDLHYKLELILESPKEKKKGDLLFEGDVCVRRNYFKRSAQIFCENSDRLHEMSYLYILSITGKRLDNKKLHRIHASAISFKERGYLFVGKSGVGKSHLAYLLPWETISDDMLFIKSEKECLPMLHRRGFISSMSKDIDLDDSYSINRLKYGEKILVPIKEKSSQNKFAIKNFYFLKPSHVSRLKKASIVDKAFYFFKYLFIGVGTPQIIKFFWEPGMIDFFVKLKIVYSRFKLWVRLTFFANAYVLETNKSEDSVKLCKSHIFEARK